MTEKPKKIVVVVDDGDLNADWIKTLRWDLPETPEGMEAVLGPEWRRRVENLPAWKAAPLSLKSSTDAYEVIRRTLKSLEAAYEGYEEKRKVRTAAGARRYGQPIGATIVADAVPDVPTPKPKPRRVVSASRSGTQRRTMSPPPPAPPKPFFSANRMAGQAFLEYGDMDFAAMGEAGDFYDRDMVEGAFSDFGTWEGNYAMRVAAAKMIGLDDQPSLGADALQPEVQKIITTGKSEGAPDWAKEEAQRFIQQAYTLVGHIGVRAHLAERDLYRGMAVPSSSPVLKVKEGDELEFTLSSFSPFPQTAMNFAETDSKNDSPVILFLEKGAATAIAPDGYEDEQEIDGEWVMAPVEEITQGTFLVTKVEKVKINGVTVTKISIRQQDVWEL